MNYFITVFGIHGQELMNDIYSEDYIFSASFHPFLDGRADMTFQEFREFLKERTDTYQFFIKSIN